MTAPRIHIFRRPRRPTYTDTGTSPDKKAHIGNTVDKHFSVQFNNIIQHFNVLDTCYILTMIYILKILQ